MASMSQSMLAHGRTLAASDHLRSSSRCINGASLKELRRTRLFFAGRRRDFSLGAWLRKGKKYEYPWPKDPDPNVEGGVLTHLSDFKPLKEKPKPVILDFEKPLMNIKNTMDDAKKKANDEGEDSSTLIAELEEKYREENAVVKERSVSVILLAGGKGKRMGASMPKQYLPLLGQPIALYSLYTFSQMIEVKEIVVVCDPSYRDIFEDTKKKINVVLKFSEPGKERQDSVYSGLQAVDPTSELVCIHDSARPLVLSRDVEKVLKDGWLHGAAVLGVPVKATIKEASGDQFVVKTLDRKALWEMQTPQVIRPALLKEGFDLVKRKGVEVTDDVSIVEHLKHPVYITQGSYTNIKITTPDDLLVAERILNSS